MRCSARARLGYKTLHVTGSVICLWHLPACMHATTRELECSTAHIRNSVKVPPLLQIQALLLVPSCPHTCNYIWAEMLYSPYTHSMTRYPMSQVQTLLLAPICPHTCDHVWRSKLHQQGSVLTAGWPQAPHPNTALQVCSPAFSTSLLVCLCYISSMSVPVCIAPYRELSL